MIVFVLILTSWLNNGSLDRSQAIPFQSEQQCLLAGSDFETDFKGEANKNPPAFRGSYAWDCKRLIGRSLSPAS